MEPRSVDGCPRTGALGQEPALGRGGDGPLAGEAAGIVDAERGVGGEFEGEVDVVLAIGLGLSAAVQAQQPQYRAAERQRSRDERMRSRRADGLGTCRIRRQPGTVGSQVQEPGTQVGQSLPERGSVGRGAYIADRMHGLHDTAAEGGTP